MYYQGKYEDAAKVFSYLNTLGPSDYRFVLGLAASLHRLGTRYEEAVRAYIFASSFDPKDPLPHFHAADCFIKMNEMDGAIECLDFAIERAGRQKKYSHIKEKAVMVQKKLKEQI